MFNQPRKRTFRPRPVVLQPQLSRMLTRRVNVTLGNRVRPRRFAVTAEVAGSEKMGNPSLERSDHPTPGQPRLARQFRPVLSPRAMPFIHPAQFPESLPLHQEAAAYATHRFDKARRLLLFELGTVPVPPPVLKMQRAIESP